MNKANINARFLSEAFLIEAVRDQAKYRLYEYFPFEIDPDSVTATYENGLLYVSGKIQDPLAKAHEIKLAYNLDSGQIDVVSGFFFLPYFACDMILTVMF